MKVELSKDKFKTIHELKKEEDEKTMTGWIAAHEKKAGGRKPHCVAQKFILNFQVR